jgi:hypothetical protein
MHTILWGSKSSDCNKDEYDRRYSLCFWNPNNHCVENMAPSLPQRCAAVSASPKFDSNPFQHIVTVGHNTTVFIYNRIRIKQEETAKLRSEGNKQLDTWHWLRPRSTVPPGCHWQLWWSASTQTPLFCPEGYVLCWRGWPKIFHWLSNWSTQ